MAQEHNYNDKLTDALKARPEVHMHTDLAKKVIQKIEIREADQALAKTRVMWFTNSAFLIASIISILIFVDQNILLGLTSYLPWIGVTIVTIGGWTLLEKRIMHHLSNTA